MSKQISASEWQVMHVIWENNPITANEVVLQLQGHTQWKEKTIKTLISRLVSKEMLTHKKVGREFHYSPLVTQEECIQSENNDFLEKVHKGRFNNMLVSFLQQEKLTTKEIQELKGILDSIDKE